MIAKSISIHFTTNNSLVLCPGQVRHFMTLKSQTTISPLIKSATAPCQRGLKFFQCHLAETLHLYLQQHNYTLTAATHPHSQLPNPFWEVGSYFHKGTNTGIGRTKRRSDQCLAMPKGQRSRGWGYTLVTSVQCQDKGQQA